MAVAIERSAELIEAVLAVPSPGCAYVPVDPGAPAERNRLVLESVDPALLLVAGEFPTDFHVAVSRCTTSSPVKYRPSWTPTRSSQR